MCSVYYRVNPEPITKMYALERLEQRNHQVRVTTLIEACFRQTNWFRLNNKKKTLVYRDRFGVYQGAAAAAAAAAATTSASLRHPNMSTSSSNISLVRLLAYCGTSDGRDLRSLVHYLGLRSSVHLQTELYATGGCAKKTQASRFCFGCLQPWA